MGDMDPNVKHHVVYFPDGVLHFDYPADLVPSRDYMMNRMDSAVDYDTIRWITPTSSAPFISMDADLRTRLFNRWLASIGLLMWLGRAPAGFEGDLLQGDDLKRAHVQIGAVENDAHAYDPLVETLIHGRRWYYIEAADVHITALNRMIFLRMRAARSGDQMLREKWIGWANAALGIILGSLRIEPNSARKLTIPDDHV